MFKKPVFVLFLFFIFFSVVYAGGNKREALKQQFAPSMNIRQMQGDAQHESYYVGSDFSDVVNSSINVGSSGQTKEIISGEKDAYRNRKPNEANAPAMETFLGEYAIYHSEYEAKIEEEIAFVKGKVSLEVFKKNGWVKIPLAESVVGLKEASLNKKPCFVVRENNKYFVIISKPGTYLLDLEFFVKVNREREHGPGNVSFDVLPSPISILDVVMQETEVEVFVEPSIKIETEKLAKQTLATVVLPYAERVSVRWSKAIAKETIPEAQLEPKLYVDTVTLVSVGDGIVRCASRLNYSILQSEVSVLSFSLPEDVGILDVSGSQLRDWKAKPKDGRQLVDVYFNYGVKGNYSLMVTYEKNIGAGSVAAQLPDMDVLATERQRGFVGIEALTNIELAFNKLNGSSVVDVKELPQEIWSQAKHPVILAFKYPKVPYSAVIDVTKHEDIPVLLAAIDSAHYVTLFTKEGKVLTKATYQMRNNVKQFIRVSLPEGAELWSCFVSGQPRKPAKDKEGKILIPLEKSQLNNEALTQFPVEVVYLSKNSKLGIAGRLNLELPSLDIPSNELLWSVYLPDRFSYLKFNGDMELARGIGFDKGLLLGNKMAGQYRLEGKAKKLSKMNAPQPQSATSLDGFSYSDQQMDFEREVIGEFQSRGALPIKINVPEKGHLYRFSKLLVTSERPWIKAYYIRSVWGVLKWLFIVIFIGVVISFLKKIRLPR